MPERQESFCEKNLLLFVDSPDVYGSTDAADKIRIAIPDPNAAYLTFPLAHKKGFFTQQNIAAEVFLMRGTLTMAALNNGDIDYLADISQGVRGRSEACQSRSSPVICRDPVSWWLVVRR